jgi:hypothetical protein
MSKNSVHVEIHFDESVLESLQLLPGMERYLGLTMAFRRAGQVVAKRARSLCPPPGYKGDKPGFKPLRDTIGVVVRHYPNVLAIYVGPQYPTGAHGHLVEYGHWLVRKNKKTGTRKVIRWVEARPFMRPAVDETREEQQEAIVNQLKRHIESVAKLTPPTP